MPASCSGVLPSQRSRLNSPMPRNPTRAPPPHPRSTRCSVPASVGSPSGGRARQSGESTRRGRGPPQTSTGRGRPTGPARQRGPRRGRVGRPRLVSGVARPPSSPRLRRNESPSAAPAGVALRYSPASRTAAPRRALARHRPRRRSAARAPLVGRERVAQRRHGLRATGPGCRAARPPASPTPRTRSASSRVRADGSARPRSHQVSTTRRRRATRCQAATRRALSSSPRWPDHTQPAAPCRHEVGAIHVQRSVVARGGPFDRSAATRGSPQSSAAVRCEKASRPGIPSSEGRGSLDQRRRRGRRVDTTGDQRTRSARPNRCGGTRRPRARLVLNGPGPSSTGNDEGRMVTASPKPAPGIRGHPQAPRSRVEGRAASPEGRDGVLCTLDRARGVR